MSKIPEYGLKVIACNACKHFKQGKTSGYCSNELNKGTKMADAVPYNYSCENLENYKEQSKS